MSGKNSARARSVVWPVLSLLACLFVWASLLTFDTGDWPSPNKYPHNDPVANACGPAGSFVVYRLRRMIGDGAYPLVLFATCAAFLWLVHGYILNPYQRVFGLALLVACTAASVHLVSRPGDNALEFGNGGLLGAALGGWLDATLSGLGTAFVVGYGFIVGVLFTAEGWVLRLPGALRRFARASSDAIAAARAISVSPAVAWSAPASALPLPQDDVEDEESEYHTERTLRINRRQDDAVQSSNGGRQLMLVDEHEPATEEETERQPASNRSKSTKRGKRRTKASSRAEKRAARSANAAPRLPFNAPSSKTDRPMQPGAGCSSALSNWRLPPITLLDTPEYAFTAAQESVLRAKAKALERALQEFRVNARVVEIDTGPVITMFELELAAGIKVSQISALANDIARTLRASSIRIIAPIPGKSTVGVEVANATKECVRLKGLLLSAEESIAKMAIPLLLGKNASGDPLVEDLAAMPHLLIAGTTGSGKSVAINAIIMSIVACRRPDMVKLILIDPKMVEMSQFKGIPHLMSPIVTDVQRAERILDWAVTKMDERYAIIAEGRVRNIAAFNKLGADEIYKRFQPTTQQEKEQIPTQLPYIVIIIDELADLMMTSGKEVEHHLSRLAQKSRAVGIHIVVATQRPEAKVVTGLIKSNLPCRMAFRVASRMDSRIVLDQNGAEVLLGQGDMLFLPPGAHKLIRAQGTYVEDNELHRVISYVCDQGQADFHPELVGMRSASSGSATERDPLFARAVEVVLESKRGSVSLLQRRLTIGYSRAARLIEQMADADIVGDYKGSQAREVLITAEQWAALNEEVVSPDTESRKRGVPSRQSGLADDDDSEDDDLDDEDDETDEDSEDEEDEEEEDEDELDRSPSAG